MFPNPKQNPDDANQQPEAIAASDASPVTDSFARSPAPAQTPAVEPSPELHKSVSTGLPSTLSEPTSPLDSPLSSPQELNTAQQQPEATNPVLAQEQPAEFNDPVEYTPVVVSSSDTQPSFQSPVKRSRKKLVIGIVAAVLIVLFGSATAVYALWYNNPKKVMADALQTAATARTTLTSGSVTIATENGADDIKADISFTSKVHNIDTQGQFAANLKLTAADTTTEFSGEGMLSESGNVFVKFNDVEKLYTGFIEKQEATAMLTQNPELSKSIQALIKKIDGNWIKISQDDLKQLSPSYDYEKLKSCYQTAQNNFIESKEQQKEIRDIYAQHEFVSLDSQGIENIDGALTNKYAVSIDVSKAYDAYVAYEKSVYGSTALLCSEHVSEAVSEQQKLQKPSDDQIREQQQQVDKLKTEVFVTQFGHELKRLKVSYADNEAKLSLNGTFNFGFNGQVSTPDPDKPVSLKELQSDIDAIQQQLMSSLMAASSGS